MINATRILAFGNVPVISTRPLRGVNVVSKGALGAPMAFGVPVSTPAGFGAPVVSSGALGNAPTITKGAFGAARSSADCGYWGSDFGTDPADPARISYADGVYQQRFFIPLPARVKAAVIARGFCTKASVAQQVLALPPTAAENAAAGNTAGQSADLQSKLDKANAALAQSQSQLAQASQNLAIQSSQFGQAQAMTAPPNPNAKYLYIGAGVLVLGGVAYALSRKKAK